MPFCLPRSVVPGKHCRSEGTRACSSASRWGMGCEAVTFPRTQVQPLQILQDSSISAQRPQATLPPLPCSPTRIQENGSLITILVIAGVFWVHRLIKFIYNICCYWEIHSFYLHALRIPMVRLGSWAISSTVQDVFHSLGRVGYIPGHQATSSILDRSGRVYLKAPKDP